MIPDFNPPEWQRDAACLDEDPEMFFPERGESTSEAKAICFACPARAECQEHGLRHEKFGIWGGLSERERRVRRRQLGIEFHSISPESEELTEEIDLRSRGGLQQPSWPKRSDSPDERSSDTGPDRELKGA